MLLNFQKSLSEFGAELKPGGLHQAGRPTNSAKMIEASSMENLKPSLHDWKLDPVVWPRVQAGRPLLGDRAALCDDGLQSPVAIPF